MVLSGILPAAASAQISGRVVDQDSREPVVHAEVVLLDSADARAAAVTSDSAGYFLIPRPAPGRYRIRVQRFGYTAHTSDEIVLQAGEPVVIELRMAARGIPIEPLVVHARGRERGRDGFVRRRELGTGAFLTPDSIVLRHPRQVADAFRAADGIDLYERPGYSPRINSMRGHRCMMV
ncbi:MAG TPA: carboxypeptidase-like regulatory domain-containing protein, partial [Longimicrobiales bacterium]|nr:carboxypeptidase-like regulatory domain-containing protein [Longimicrobiales bacterium]